MTNTKFSKEDILFFAGPALYLIITVFNKLLDIISFFYYGQSFRFLDFMGDTFSFFFALLPPILFVAHLFISKKKPGFNWIAVAFFGLYSCIYFYYIFNNLIGIFDYFTFRNVVLNLVYAFWNFLTVVFSALPILCIILKKDCKYAPIPFVLISILAASITPIYTCFNTISWIANGYFSFVGDIIFYFIPNMLTFLALIFLFASVVLYFLKQKTEKPASL